MSTPNPAAPSTPAVVAPHRWRALAALVVSLLVVVLDNTVLNVALKTIQQDLGATQSQLIWAINAYSLVFAALLFTWGVLGDRYGRRRILIIGLLLFAAASLLSAFAQTPEQLIVARALMGIGGASVLPVTLSIITVIFPPAERGKAIGIWAAAVGGAVALGPLLGGFLLEHFWWGSVFLINIPIIIIGIGGILANVPESRNPHPGRLDPVGLVLSVVGLLALVYGIQEAGWSEPVTYAWIAFGVAVLAGFLFWESRTDHPSMDLSLFSIRSFSVPLAATSLTFAALTGSLIFLAFYYQVVRGWSPLQSGALTVPFAIGQLLSAPRSGKMVARFGARRVIPFGLVLASTAMFMFTRLNLTTPVWALVIIPFVFGFGMGNVVAPSTTRMTLATPPQRSGAGSAVQNTVRQVGATLGVAIICRWSLPSTRARCRAPCRAARYRPTCRRRPPTVSGRPTRWPRSCRRRGRQRPIRPTCCARPVMRRSSPPSTLPRTWPWPPGHRAGDHPGMAPGAGGGRRWKAGGTSDPLPGQPGAGPAGEVPGGFLRHGCGPRRRPPGARGRRGSRSPQPCRGRPVGASSGGVRAREAVTQGPRA